MDSKVPSEDEVSSKLTEAYLRYEKFIIPVFLVTFLSFGFYYVDWHNHLLWKEGMKFYELDTGIDRAIPFVPWFIWLYLLYYPFCFTPIVLLNNRDTFRRIAAGFLMEFVLAFIVFLTFPVKMIRPEVTASSLSTKAVALLYSIDPGFNVFPSLHVANSLFVALIFYRYSKPVGILFMLIAVLISISTLYVKQHYLFDIVTGALDTLMVYPVVFRGHRPVKA